MAELFDRSFGSVADKSVAELNRILRKQPVERMKIIEALETDFLGTLELLFDIEDMQRDALSDLHLSGMDRVVAMAAAEALRRGYQVEFRTQRAPDDAPQVNLRLEVDSQRPSASHRPNVTVIVWCICRF
jgi:hypothetical protein